MFVAVFGKLLVAGILVMLPASLVLELVDWLSDELLGVF